MIKLLNQKQIYEYALKGLAAEIEKIDKDIKQGYEFIKQIDKGEKVKTPKTRQEILNIVNEKTAEMEKLEKELFSIKWQIGLNDEN